ncbi:hypothetical protein G647_07683 [Cladophialophora carrionii CBS 160.54]|uniref:Nuclear pore assembly and biogenesis-domain-containing protein n=1 Tax=Cladophialophora carrionii CBS 160.54 TaxID=1279043 RepID=V9D5S2_9EURO|nr:uncharacterized protein G647_07683 [Cladophialophora carrionii CBS 160.54]ETI21337.1 hypothetical protein G647_07683 [Cladophialophora carrionii CBS 160.54]
MTPQPPTPALPSFIHHFASLYDSYILPHLPDPLQSLSNNISPFLGSILSAASNGDVVSLAAFLLTVYLSLKIADYIRRSVVGWVVFLVKIVVVLVLVQAALYVNRNGLQKALGDAEWVVGILWGLVEDKVVGNGDGRDNRTGGYGSGYGNGAWGSSSNSHGSRRQQQGPVGGRGRQKARSAWT